MSYIDEIKNYIVPTKQEEQNKKVILNYIELFPNNVLSRDNEIAHITSSGFILNPRLDKMLMVHHNIRDTWSWTGGHADGNSNLLEVAIQEAIEETGVNVTPLFNEIASLDILTVPGHTKKETYVNSHLHLSIAYILIADESTLPVVKPDENSAVAWFSTEKLNEAFFSSHDVHFYTKLLERARAAHYG